MSARKYEYFKACQSCGSDKPWTKNRLCKTCGGRKSMDAIRKNAYYAICQTCGYDKPRNRRPNCRHCGGVNSAITIRRKLVESGALPLPPTGYRHNVPTRTLDPVEAADRQRGADQCARVLRARIASRFPPGSPMNRANVREMFAPDRDEGDANG